MKKRPAGISLKIREIRKNIQALKQMNLTPAQAMNMLKEPVLWFRVTRNFREIEGSWFKAIKLYVYMFEGVPDKRRDKSAGSNRKR